MNIKILVCCHKKDVMVKHSPYFPIHVGKAISNVELGIQGDDKGDNISNKNQSFCECTGMYWAWKNLKNVDVIGLCHYRRYFDFHNSVSNLLFAENINPSEFDKFNFDVPQETLITIVREGAIVVPKQLNQLYSLFDKYCIGHNSSDIRIVEQIIKEQGDETTIKAFNQVMKNDDRFITCNMCLMRWEDYDEYCNWLFNLLFECEKRIDISNYNVEERRVFGYIAERMFNVWLVAKKKKLIFKRIIKISDEKPSSFSDRIHFKLGQVRKRILFKLLYKKY